MSLDRYYPEDDPNWQSLWDHRPFGPEFSFNPFTRDWPYSIPWHVAGIATLTVWTRYTGMGVSANMALGELIWGPPHVQMYSKHIYQRGASPTFTGGLWDRRAMIGRGSATVGMLVGPSVVGYLGTKSQADKMARTPGREHEAPGIWQTFAQAVTGTGPGVGGWDPGY